MKSEISLSFHVKQSEVTIASGITNLKKTPKTMCV